MIKIMRSFMMAISMFTVIPVPVRVWDDDGVKHMMKLYPLVGLVVGIITHLTYRLTLILNLSLILRAAITMVVPFIITGMLHLDGYMDVCDALLSRRNQKEKIRILKDPNTGAFAVISFAILFLLNFASVYTLIDKNLNTIGIIFIPIISRALMAILLLKKETMKESSLGSYFKMGTGIIDIIILFILLSLATLGLIYFIGNKAIIVSFFMVVIGLLSVNKSSKELGGMSGDSAGYGLVISEFVGLFLLAILN